MHQWNCVSQVKLNYASLNVHICAISLLLHNLFNPVMQTHTIAKLGIEEVSLQAQYFHPLEKYGILSNITVT